MMKVMMMTMMQFNGGVCVPVGLCLPTSSKGGCDPHPDDHHHGYDDLGGRGVRLGLCRPPCHS